jgi:hypothetical protein
MPAKHVFYYSKRCIHCNKLLSIIDNVPELKEEFNMVNIESGTPLPSIIQSVPSILIDKNKLASGRQAFAFVEEERKLYLDAFEHGFGGNQFSYIDTDGLCEGNKNFTFLTDEGFQTQHIAPDQSPYVTREQASQSKKSELDDLIAKRNAEVTQPISRQ